MKNPQLGDKAICKMCDKEIEYVGSYWRHIGLQPRHPAQPDNPKDDEAERLACRVVVATRRL